MASAIAHALIGGAVGLIATRQIDNGSAAGHTSLNAGSRRVLPWLTAGIAVLPDADVLTHLVVAYEHPLGHRGAFHSLAFYSLVAALLAFLPHFRDCRLGAAAALWLSLTSHSLLDMLSNGGLGVAVWWPYSDSRHFFGWRPIPVSPLSIPAFFTGGGLQVLRAELPWSLACLGLSWLYSRGDSELPRRDPYGDDDVSRNEEPSANDHDVAVMEIEDSIDLHHFAPRDILDVVDAYLEAAAEKGFEEVRLIHGRGKGVQRARIQKLLRSHPLVLRYRDAPATRGGWGATLAWLTRHPPATVSPPKQK